MNKDFEQKNDAVFHSAGLRGRISAAIKSERDEGEELKRPHGKSLLEIPVTGTGSEHKYVANKQKGGGYKS